MEATYKADIKAGPSQRSLSSSIWEDILGIISRNYESVHCSPEENSKNT